MASGTRGSRSTASAVHAGAVNVYGTAILRLPLAYESFNLRSSVSLGTSYLISNLYGAPSGSLGVFGGVSFLGLEWKVARSLLRRHRPARLSWFRCRSSRACRSSIRSTDSPSVWSSTSGERAPPAGHERSRMTRLRLMALVLAAAALVPLACGSPPRALTPAPTAPLSPQQTALWSEARDVFETRCVVCHGCYDAPCQLKLGSFDGIERGATRATRSTTARGSIAAQPTRLDVDAHDAGRLAEEGLPPGRCPRGPRATRARVSSCACSTLKRAQPAPPRRATSPRTSRSSSIARRPVRPRSASTTTRRLTRSGACRTRFPALDEPEERALVALGQGRRPASRAPRRSPRRLSASIAEWEAFLERAVAEEPARGALHLRAPLPGAASTSKERGEDDVLPTRALAHAERREVDEIPTRRPFDDPGGRARLLPLRPAHGAPAREDAHALPRSSAARLRRWKELFLAPKYVVGPAPGLRARGRRESVRAFQVIPVELALPLHARRGRVHDDGVHQGAGLPRAGGARRHRGPLLGRLPRPRCPAG